MANAIVLINVENGKATEVALKVKEVKGVREVYSIAGDFDLVAIVEAADQEAFEDIIPGGIAKIPGVQRTHTLMAFRTYSKQEMTAAFDLGMD